jgi:hypothetical protein
MGGVNNFSVAVLIFLFAAVYRAARRQKTDPGRRATQKFIAAFIDAVQDLSQGKGDTYELLREAFPKRENAYLQFLSRMRGALPHSL